MDKLTIEGVSSRFDGEYDCHVFGMIADVTSEDALTGDEACYIQEQSSVRGNELIRAFLAGDFKFLMALTVVVLARQGKNIDVDALMSQKIGAYRFELETTVAEEDEKPHPTNEGEPSPTTSKNGGTSSASSSENQDDHLALTGAPV